MGRTRVLVSWSSGKDGAWLLHELRSAGEVEIDGLLTTVGREDGRVPMHGVRRELVAAQADAAGLPLVEVPIPTPCPNEAWERAIAETLAAARGRGVTAVAFGDLFLEDVRAYRESRLEPTGLEALFPLWGRSTHRLARRMITAGLEAIVTSVDSEQIDASFAGRPFDERLLADLPPTADPCGERGELHTFVHAGPMLSGRIAVEVGPIVRGERFVTVDVRPRGEAVRGGRRPPREGSETV